MSKVKNVVNSKKNLLLYAFLIAVLISFFNLCFLLLTSDYSSIFSKSLVDKKIPFIQIEKYQIEQNDFTNRMQISLEGSDELEIENKISEYSYAPIYLRKDMQYNTVSNLLKTITYKVEDNIPMYNSSDMNADIVVVNDFESFIKEDIIGRLPINENEILISNYIADLMILEGVTTYNHELYKPESYSDIINEENEYYFGNSGKVKIVGIINYDLSDFQIFKEYYIDECSQLSGLCDSLNYKIFNEYRKNIFNKIYVLESFITSNSLNYLKQLDVNNYSFNVEGSWGKETLLVYPFILNHSIECYDGEKWKTVSSLKENEIILNIYQIVPASTKFQEKFEQYRKKYSDIDFETIKKQFIEEYLEESSIIGSNVTLKITDSNNSDVVEEYTDLKVIGITAFSGGNLKESYYLPENFESKYIMTPMQKTGYLVLANEYDLKKLFKLFPYNEELSLKYIYSNDFLISMEKIGFIKKVGRYLFIILFFFVLYFIRKFSLKNNCEENKEKKLKSICFSRIVLVTILAEIINFPLLFIISKKLNAFISDEIIFLSLGINEVVILLILMMIILSVSTINLLSLNRKR